LRESVARGEQGIGTSAWEESKMLRLFIFSAALALIALASVQPGMAYEGPWCVKAPIGRGAVVDICHFRTIEQCLQERTLWGGSAFCVQNARYLPYWKNRGLSASRRPAQ
jgi:hypothetical protein